MKSISSQLQKILAQSPEKKRNITSEKNSAKQSLMIQQKNKRKLPYLKLPFNVLN